MKLIRLIAAPILLAFLWAGATPVSAADEEGVAVAIVYDTSGSMKDPVKDENGKASPKFQIANRALIAIANRIQSFATIETAGGPRKIQAGLFVFQNDGPHAALPLGPFNAGALTNWAHGFSAPGGGTPLGKTLNAAGEAVLHSGLTRKHVLVITDGMNTAGPDPASILARLQQQAGQKQTSVSVHFVAFDVDAKVFDGVKKLGATVAGASNEQQLNTQLEFILEKKILLEDEEPPKKTVSEKESIMFRAFKRVFIWLGLLAEQATETDAINQAVVERGIRDSKVKADKAHYANGQLAGQIALLKDQIKRQERQRDDLQGMLQAAVAANDEANGAHYAEELSTLEQDLADNKSQADSLEQLYRQNTEIIAQSLREIQKFQREFESVKAKVAIGRSLESLAGMMKSSINELQGMMGGEMGQSMQQLRQSAAGGEGQMRATLDLAKEMGSGISRQQEMRKARGALLFQEYKKKMGMVQPEVAATAPTAGQPAEKQKIAE